MPAETTGYGKRLALSSISGVTRTRRLGQIRRPGVNRRGRCLRTPRSSRGRPYLEPSKPKHPATRHGAALLHHVADAGRSQPRRSPAVAGSYGTGRLNRIPRAQKAGQGGACLPRRAGASVAADLVRAPGRRDFGVGKATDRAGRRALPAGLARRCRSTCLARARVRAHGGVFVLCAGTITRTSMPTMTSAQNG